MSQLGAAVRVPAPHGVELPAFPDERGRLTVAEAGANVPFEIKRVYWITDVPPGARRGGHAHRRATELLVAVAGSFVVRCTHPQHGGEFELGAGGPALLVPPLVWREAVGFTAGAVCLVLASEPYDEDEYVHDLEEFQALAGRA